MRSVLFQLFSIAAISTVVSCGGENNKSPESNSDSSEKSKTESLMNNSDADSSLAPVKQFFEKELAV
ncbi:MAG: hypothetical protein FJY20_01300 [Bacteroidetes bacterium]|nr:hypothetical protein [Bacteroidota bacterium]